MLKLLIKNSTGTFDISQLAPTITWAGNYQQCARSLDFGLISSPTDKSIPVVKCELGNAITLMQDDLKIDGAVQFDRFMEIVKGL